MPDPRLACALALCVWLPACDLVAVRLPPAVPDAPSAVASSAEDAPPLTAVTAAPVLTGRGHAQVSRQPGDSLNQRRLLALRAARIDAMRDLAEQIHGLELEAETRVGDAILREDRLRASVEGVIRGARTVSITPTSADTYEVVLALDPAATGLLLRALRAMP